MVLGPVGSAATGRKVLIAGISVVEAGVGVVLTWSITVEDAVVGSGVVVGCGGIVVVGSLVFGASVVVGG